MPQLRKIYQNVVRLYVPVCNLSKLQINHSIEQLLYDQPKLSLPELPVEDFFLYGTDIGQLHEDVVAFVSCDYFDELNTI